MLPVFFRRARARQAQLRRFVEPLLLATLLATLLIGCGTEVIKYETLFLEIKSELPTSGTIAFLDIAALKINESDDAKRTFADGDKVKSLRVTLPDDADITGKGHIVEITQPQASRGLHSVRVLGLSDKEKILTAYSGVINTNEKKLHSLVLTAPDLNCDEDGDGAKNCAKEGCCGPNEVGDCNDQAATASPYSSENPCTQCGNKIDEDCDGEDTPCVDSDNDGVADCIEDQSCGGDAKNDKDVHPNAPEVCDGKDNNCDGKVDELNDNLTYIGLDGTKGSKEKGTDCGVGACTGGKVVCNPKDTSQLVCSSTDKKAAQEDCGNDADDDCNGKVNDGCALKDIDGDGVTSDVEDKACANPYAKFHPEFGTSQIQSDYENRRCCLAWTKAILAKDKNWKKTTAEDFGVPKDVPATKALLAACDFNCDGAIAPCAHDDKDGDGVPAGLDCKDNDADIFPTFSGNPGAAERCDDGVDQDCIGGDEKCTDDKDGDKYNAKHDCDDNDKSTYPGAPELCDAKDNNCNGIADDGNAEAEDKECGNPAGECGKQRGVTVCKHWPVEQEPAKLDCLKKPLDESTRTCVGCEGDTRPAEDVCDYLDNDCDGTSDEDYTYDKQAGTKRKVGEACDGVGECGAGTVECHKGKKHATCSTDPDGSKAQNKVEVCDNKDNDCDGNTDESLTAIADATCRKVGVCGGNATSKLKTVCKAGKWVCDYSGVPNIQFDKAKKCAAGDGGCHCAGLGDTCYELHELKCDGKDNDCSGKTDEDFTHINVGAGGKKVKMTYGSGNTACGTGACAGGKIVCNAKGDGVTCSTLVKTKKESCDLLDNDCNGFTDDAMTTSDSNCKLQGACTLNNVKASCVSGLWSCDYSAVKDYEGAKKKSCPFTKTSCIYGDSFEKTCDGKDNDCDGKTDEDFSYTNIGAGGKATKLAKGASCGTGACVGGKVVCTGSKSGLTCSTLGKKSKDICDGKDNDCDGIADEDYTYVEHGSANSLKVGQACDGIGSCGKGIVECLASKAAVTCSTDPNGSKSQQKKEICDDADNDCDKIVDEGCDDDGDNYCDGAMYTPAKPKVCPKGGGDCKDKDANYNPGIAEQCDSKDNNCNGQTDEVFFWVIPYDPATSKSGKLGVGKSCGLGVCAGGTVVCDSSKSGAHCTTYSPGKDAKNKPETLCDNKDNDCDGLTDEGCDDDGDDYCDKNLTTIGSPKVCPKGGGDCNDTKASGKEVHPNHVELCNNIDDNCAGGVDEKCDQDGDGFCDAKRITIGKPKVCPKGGGDCNDDAASGGKEIYPGHIEWCDDVDQNCNSKIDEGCDDDKDGYCDNKLKWAFKGSGAPKICPKGKGDCNDKLASFHPTAVEICDNKNQDCDGQTDEGCDDDSDGYCEVGKVVVGTPKVCNKGAGDCNDKDWLVHPGAKEICNGKDDDCDKKIDAKDADLAKVRPNCSNQTGVCAGSKKPVSLCQAGAWGDCTTTHYKAHSTKFDGSSVEKLCDDYDNDCDGKVDIGCDADGDGYCTSARTTVGKPKVCPKGGGDCNDTNGATGKSINPGAKENCATTWDDNCNNSTNDLDAKACIVFYRDLDGDKWGTSDSTAPPQCRCEGAGKWTALKSGDCDDFNKGSSSYSWTDPKGATVSIGNTCGLGECSSGAVKCNGKTATCSTYFGAGNKKSEEICDGKDNDCDGKIDDKPKLTLSSCSDSGVCKGKGVTPECSNGKEICDYASNVGGYAQIDDSCDNKDNNCDGKTDESADVSAFPCEQKGVCGTKAITAKCVAGKPTCDYSSITTWQATETKCDGKDNDCDGTTDETPDLSALTCSSKGVCAGKTATKSCEKGVGVCSFPGVSDWEKIETKCDNKDNDCDGTVDGINDMNVPNDCVQGVCTADQVKGLCTKGKWSCDYSGVSLYEAETKTTSGVCTDDKDNDCDGDKDASDSGCK